MGKEREKIHDERGEITKSRLYPSFSKKHQTIFRDKSMVKSKRVQTLMEPKEITINPEINPPRQKAHNLHNDTQRKLSEMGIQRSLTIMDSKGTNPKTPQNSYL